MGGEITVERREFVSRLMAAVPDALAIAGLGSPAWDLFAAGDRDANFYLWGAMGGAASMGLGLAIAQPDRSVLVVTGDGEQLMGMGSLATVALQRPPNLTIVVLDNGHFAETGMQRSHTSAGTDLAAVARACGIADAFVVDGMDGVEALAKRIRDRRNTAFAAVKVGTQETPRALPPRDGAYLKNRFRAALGLSPP